MSKETPEISVVVCHHTGNFILQFVDSLGFSTTMKMGRDYEVIVMTSDEHLALKGIDGCNTYYSNELPAAKRNIGVKLSKGKYIAFFDDDVEVDDKCLEYLRYGMMQTNCGMVYGKLHKFRTTQFDEAGGYLTWNGFIWSRAEQNIPDTGQYDDDVEILAGKSASCMISKDIFNQVGGFDESFGILGEETDLSWRVWLAGYKVWYCPSSLAYHKFNTALKPFKKFYSPERVYFNGCRNYITMLLKNLGKEHLWIVPIHCLIWAFVGLVMIGTGKFQVGWNIWRGLFYILKNRKEILRKRGHIQATRRVSDKELWPSIYRSASGSYYWTRFKRYIGSGLHG